MTPLTQTIRAWSRASDHLVASILETNRAAFALFDASDGFRVGAGGTPSDETPVPPSQDDAPEAVPGYGPTPDPAMPSIASEQWESERTVDEPSAIAVGDVVRFTKTIDEADVVTFAQASGDTNRLHLDESFAGETRFRGRIAHGTLVSGLISAALARIPGVTVYLSQDLEFLAPVAVGDELTATVEVLEALGGDRYRLDTTVETGGNVVVRGEAVVLVDPLPHGVAP